MSLCHEAIIEFKSGEGFADWAPFCFCELASSLCCNDAGNYVKIVTNVRDEHNGTVGLYDECRCKFWSRLCEDTQQVDACDYAAEYCCGDYFY